MNQEVDIILSMQYDIDYLDILNNTDNMNETIFDDFENDQELYISELKNTMFMTINDIISITLFGTCVFFFLSFVIGIIAPKRFFKRMYGQQYHQGFVSLYLGFIFSMMMIVLGMILSIMICLVFYSQIFYVQYIE